MLAFALVLMLVGALLLYSGFRGTDPRDELKAFTGGKSGGYQ